MWAIQPGSPSATPLNVPLNPLDPGVNMKGWSWRTASRSHRVAKTSTKVLCRSLGRRIRSDTATPQLPGAVRCTPSCSSGMTKSHRLGASYYGRSYYYHSSVTMAQLPIDAQVQAACAFLDSFAPGTRRPRGSTTEYERRARSRPDPARGGELLCLESTLVPRPIIRTSWPSSTRPCSISASSCSLSWPWPGSR